jgi:hypothetical protein
VSLVDPHEGYVDDLGPLLRGELPRARHAEVVEHLDSCEACRRDLVDAASSHGGLTAMRRILSGALEPVNLPPTPALVPPRRARRAPARTWQVVLAAVAVALTTIGLYAGLHRDAAPSGRLATGTRSAPLAAVTGNGSGRVVMHPDTSAATVMTISTLKLPPAGSGRYYYAWLLDPKTNKMLPLGVVGPDGAATFELQTAIVGRYHAVDVSLQSDNGNPAHSATSVLRATY